MTGHGSTAGVEWDQVQRVLLRGYTKLTWAHFFLLRITRCDDARRFLAELLDDESLKFGWGQRPDTDGACNVAFTREGLEALGLDGDTVAGFSPEFLQGMASSSRARKLGDSGGSDPKSWHWGNAATAVHATLMTYAHSEAALAPAVARLRERLSKAGFEEVRGPSGEDLGATRPLAERREHFGFRDGISQPRFADEPSFVRPRVARDADRLAAGELLLGYSNEAGIFPRSPALSAAGQARAAFFGSKPDFGRNGSYLVFRTLEQDVGLFWRTTLRNGGTEGLEARVEFAAKMVGRWPDGRPLVSITNGSGQRTDPEDFDYAHDDPLGHACPFGAHIRRTNPRATLSRDPAIGLQKSKKHRILRRGRTYGEPFTPQLTPTDIVKAADSNAGRPGPRGLHFMCYNADIANQFEFVQQTWVNGPVFQGLHGEVDPLVGNPDPTGGLFTIPGSPIRSRVHEIPRFVHVRGGAYLFLPSHAALRYLAALRD
jgi:Dyp-type peroxidase family